MSPATLETELDYVGGEVVVRASHGDDPPTIIGPHERDGYLDLLATGHYRVGDAGCRSKTPSAQLIRDELSTVAIDAEFVAVNSLDTRVREVWAKHQEARL